MAASENNKFFHKSSTIGFTYSCWSAIIRPCLMRPDPCVLIPLNWVLQQRAWWSWLLHKRCKSRSSSISLQATNGAVLGQDQNPPISLICSFSWKRKKRLPLELRRRKTLLRQNQSKTRGVNHYRQNCRETKTFPASERNANVAAISGPSSKISAKNCNTSPVGSW